MAFRTPQTGHEMPRDYAIAVENKYVYTVFKNHLERAVAQLRTLKGYSVSKMPFALVTSFIDNGPYRMIYRMAYAGAPLLDPFRLELSPIEACQYISTIEDGIGPQVTTIMEVHVPDFSFLHKHRHMVAIADDPRFFAALHDVVGMAISMIVDPKCVHVVILQPGKVDHRLNFSGMNESHITALQCYCDYFAPIVNRFSITTNEIRNTDHFVVIHKSCSALLRTMLEMAADSSPSTSEEEEDY